MKELAFQRELNGRHQKHVRKMPDFCVNPKISQHHESSATFTMCLSVSRLGSSFRQLDSFGCFLKLRVPFGGPHKKDYSLLGSIFRSPYLGKSPFTQPKHFWFQASTFDLECQTLNPPILNHTSQTLHPIFDKLLTQKLRTQYTPQDTIWFSRCPPPTKRPLIAGKPHIPTKCYVITLSVSFLIFFSIVGSPSSRNIPTAS